MAMYRIIDGGNIYSLDAVLTGSVTMSGRVTEKPIQQGAMVSDHYVNLNNGMNFSGKLSDVKRMFRSSANNNTNQTLPAVLDVITELRDLKESGRLITLEVAPSSGLTFNDCVIEDFSVSNDITTGQMREEFFAFNVSLKIKQIRRSKRGAITSEVDSVLKDTTQDKTTGSGANSVPDVEKRSAVQAAQEDADRARAERDALEDRLEAG